MSTILIAHKVESSFILPKGHRFSKYEQIHKLMLICFNVQKKAITKNSKFL